MDKHLDFMRNTSIFKGISNEEFELLLDTLDSQLKFYTKGQIVLKAGGKVSRAGLLLEGNVEIFREGFWGAHYVIGEVNPGELFAVAFASTEKLVSNVTCAASKNCVILWFDLQEIFNLDDNGKYHTILIKNLMSTLSMQSLNISSKMSHITQKTTREKLLSYLSEEAYKNNSNEFDIPYDRQALANYLSVERSAMSNELSKLQKAGYLTSKRNHFILHKI